MRSLRRLLNAGRRAVAAFATRRDGGPAVEFALVAPFFIVVIYATAQVSIISICNSYLETAAEESAREVLTNQTGSMTAAQFSTAVCNNMPAIFNCANLMISLQPETTASSVSTAPPTFNANGSLATTLPYVQPAQNQIGVLEIMYPWPVIGLPLGWNFANLGNGTYLMTSTQVFKVEPQT